MDKKEGAVKSEAENALLNIIPFRAISSILGVFALPE